MAESILEPIARPAEAITTPVRSPWGRVWIRLRANRSAQLGMAVIGLITLVAVLAPILNPYNPRADLDLANSLKPPSPAHWLGTDVQGRNILVRLAQGAHVSLGVGVISVAISLITGTLIGLVSGLTGGRVDSVLMRLMDIMLAFPGLLLAIAIVAIRGPGLPNTMLAISIINIPTYARLSRSMALSLREQDYILASRSLGVSESRIVFAHLLPNSLSPLIVQATLGIGSAILETAALGFLGLGQQPPFPEWGAELADSTKYLTSGAWWALLFPGLAIMVTVLGFNLLGDGLRDALDPRLQR